MPLLSALLAIHIFAQSKAMPMGTRPVGKVPIFNPSVDRNRVTWFAPKRC